MARKTKKDPTAWRSTPDGTRKYQSTREQAQNKANETGMDQGIEANDFWKEFISFSLPAKQYRSGHELRCEVVSCEDVARIMKGHGP
jgi:hypothetical protein